MPRLLLLDSASLYYRAFFGVPDTMKAPDGTVVNALRGILDFTATLATAHQPDTIVACWDDDWRPQWRVDLMPSYKTHRVAVETAGVEETPDLLLPQVPLIAEAFGLLGIPVLGAIGAEADDVIGTLAGVWDGPVDVVTGDRDLFQLVDDAKPVRVLYTSRGVRDADVVDEAWIRAKYGVDSHRYVDFAVMRGDASDGIPGVPGIGEKTAATLLAAHGDLDGILAAAADPTTKITPRIRQSLLDSAEYIERARTIVAVRGDVPVVIEPGALDAAAFEAFGERWGLGGATGRVLTALAGS